MADLLLASASPRRKELLDQIAVNYITRSMDIDESIIDGESAHDYVSRLAIEKARSGLEFSGGLAVLAADTSVVIDDQILGKPNSEQHAVEMLQLLSGRSHQVLTGIALLKLDGDELIKSHKVVKTDVTFLPLTLEQIKAYIATKEPMDKAGAYGIQGKAAVFVDKIEGSYSNVVGLPLEQVGIMLQRFNIPIWNA